jgi:hypothetical protein
MAEKCIGLGKIGEGALDLARRALTIEVPNPRHPTAINAGVQHLQSAAAVTVKRVNNLEFEDSTRAKC